MPWFCERGNYRARPKISNLRPVLQTRAWRCSRWVSCQQAYAPQFESVSVIRAGCPYIFLENDTEVMSLKRPCSGIYSRLGFSSIVRNFDVIWSQIRRRVVSWQKKGNLARPCLCPAGTASFGNTVRFHSSEKRKAAFRTSICGYNSDPARRELHKDFDSTICNFLPGYLRPVRI
jgi:hypothetical protein